MKEACNLLRYAVSTSDRALYYHVQGPNGEARISNEISLEGHFDANFGAGKPRQGFLLLLMCLNVFWRSIRQATEAHSTSEAELVASSFAVRELLGFRNLIADLFPKLVITLKLYGDNQAANLIANAQAGVRKV